MKNIYLFLLLFFLGISVNAQVTIGSDNPPLDGILLDLKEQAPDNENVTAKKGLLIPRVTLVAKKSLDPLVLNVTSPTEKEKYRGTIVYNVKEITGDATNRSLSKGLYMWNGEEWTMVGKTGNPNFFYMPSFNLPLGAVGSTQTINLYNEYVRQFKYDNVKNPYFKNGQGLVAVPGIYASSDLYYIVLDYTPGIISDLQMDASGNLSYKTVNNTIPPNAYINIICVVKE